MGEAKEVRTVEIEHLSTQTNGYPRDLLQRFTAGNHCPAEFRAATEDTEEIELNLGLSLGGCFGVDPKEKRLIRSSSIAGLTTLLRDDDIVLARTSSLPTETEEERRKRKELQSLRRMEAKRKRSEKQRNLRAGKDRASLERNYEEDKRTEERKVEGTCNAVAMQQQQHHHQQYMVANGFSSSVAPPFGPPTWAAPALGAPNGRSSALTGAAAAASALLGLPPPSSQGSLGSQGSSSSGISEFETRPAQGLSNCSEARSPASVQSMVEQSEQKPIIPPRSTTTEKSGIFARVVEVENPSKKPKVIDNGTRETGMNVMEEMPCVSTRGDGPNGKRIEGFLYKYGKGEEVRIVCVCHGSFLSPAEFVKHAGGGDVAHPLKHIVVNTNSSSFV